MAENITADKITGAIFVTDLSNYSTTLDDPDIWCKLELPGQEWVRFVLGDKDSDAAQVWVVNLPPNYVVPRHYHTVHRMEILLKGSYMMDGKLRKPGSIMVFKANEEYGPLHFGPEGGTTLEVFPETPGQPIFTDAPSEEVVRNLSRMGMTPLVKKKVA